MTDPYRQAAPSQFHGHGPAPAGYPVAPNSTPPVPGYPLSPAHSGGDRQFQVKLRKHTGALIVFQYRTYVVTGTLEQCEHAYRAAQTYNLLAGWWSFLSLLLLNWIALFSNMSAISQLRRIAKQSQAPGLPPAQTSARVPAGWYRDPSGTAGQRYWDGAAWTQWTNNGSP